MRRMFTAYVECFFFRLLVFFCIYIRVNLVRFWQGEYCLSVFAVYYEKISKYFQTIYCTAYIGVHGDIFISTDKVKQMIIVLLSWRTLEVVLPVLQLMSPLVIFVCLSLIHVLRSVLWKLHLPLASMESLVNQWTTVKACRLRGFREF